MGENIYRKKDCMFAYFAGAIDSDGFVSIQRSTRKSKSGTVHTYYNAKIGFTSSNQTVVQHLLKENFGGAVYTYQPDNPNYKAWSVWQVSDRHARRVLEALLPYLIIKKRQAELVIEFVGICERQREEMGRVPKPRYHLTPAMLALREHYWAEVGRLNDANGSEACAAGILTAPHYSHMVSADRT